VISADVNVAWDSSERIEILMARRKPAGNGVREYRLDKDRNGQLHLQVRGIHQGQYFSESVSTFEKADFASAMMDLRALDVVKRGVSDLDAV